MRVVILVISALILLSACGSGVGLVGVWHFGVGGNSYGIVSITNEIGIPNTIYIGNRAYGPIGDGETIIIQLQRGSYWIRDYYGHSRYINIHSTETIFIVFR